MHPKWSCFSWMFNHFISESTPIHPRRKIFQHCCFLLKIMYHIRFSFSEERPCIFKMRFLLAENVPEHCNGFCFSKTQVNEFEQKFLQNNKRVLCLRPSWRGRLKAWKHKTCRTKIQKSDFIKIQVPNISRITLSKILSYTGKKNETRLACLFSQKWGCASQTLAKMLK